MVARAARDRGALVIAACQSLASRRRTRREEAPRPLAILCALSADLFRIAGALTNAAKRGHRPPGARLAGGAGFFFMGSIGLVTPQQMHFSEPLPLKSGAALSDYALTFETYGTPERRQQQRRPGVPCAQRQPPRRRRARRRQRRLVGQPGGPRQAAGHRPLLRHRRQQPGLVLRLHRADARQPGHRPRLWRRLPGGDGGRLGRRAGPPDAATGHRRGWPPWSAAAWAACRRWPGRCATRRACATAWPWPRRPTCRRRTSPSTKWRGAPSSPTPTSTAATSMATAWCPSVACAWRA